MELIAFAVKRETHAQGAVPAMAVLDLCIEEVAPIPPGTQPSAHSLVKTVREALTILKVSHQRPTYPGFLFPCTSSILKLTL